MNPGNGYACSDGNGVDDDGDAEVTMLMLVYVSSKMRQECNAKTRAFACTTRCGHSPLHDQGSVPHSFLCPFAKGLSLPQVCSQQSPLSHPHTRVL